MERKLGARKRIRYDNNIISYYNTGANRIDRYYRIIVFNSDNNDNRDIINLRRDNHETRPLIFSWFSTVSAVPRTRHWFWFLILFFFSAYTHDNKFESDRLTR